MNEPRVIVFASGTPTAGGSGFENLINHSRGGDLHARIVAVVSNHPRGGVWQKAQRLGVEFVHFPAPWSPDCYRQIVADHHADFVALSGWLKLVAGLDPRVTVNIHPAPLPDFGGPGMYGHHLHKKVLEAFAAGKIAASAVCMHFATEQFDRGPVFFRAPVPIEPDDTPDSLGDHVRRFEHYYQPGLLDLVVNGTIRWDGESPLRPLGPDDFVSRSQKDRPH